MTSTSRFPSGNPQTKVEFPTHTCPFCGHVEVCYYALSHQQDHESHYCSKCFKLFHGGAQTTL